MDNKNLNLHKEKLNKKLNGLSNLSILSKERINKLKKEMDNIAKDINGKSEKINNYKDCLKDFLEEEKDNKSLLKELNKEEKIFTSRSRFFKSGKKKIELYQHDKVDRWKEAKDDFLRSMERMHSLMNNLILAEQEVDNI